MATRVQEKEALISLREKLIGELHTLPFTVYDDATLERLLDVRPKSIAELTQVKGFPEKGKRVTGFGEAIVQIFTNLDNVKEFCVEVKDGKPCLETKLKSMNIF